MGIYEVSLDKFPSHDSSSGRGTLESTSDSSSKLSSPKGSVSKESGRWEVALPDEKNRISLPTKLRCIALPLFLSSVPCAAVVVSKVGVVSVSIAVWTTFVAALPLWPVVGVGSVLLGLSVLLIMASFYVSGSKPTLAAIQANLSPEQRQVASLLQNSQEKFQGLKQLTEQIIQAVRSTEHSQKGFIKAQFLLNQLRGILFYLDFLGMLLKRNLKGVTGEDLVAFVEEWGWEDELTSEEIELLRAHAEDLKQIHPLAVFDKMLPDCFLSLSCPNFFATLVGFCPSGEDEKVFKPDGRDFTPLLNIFESVDAEGRTHILQAVKEIALDLWELIGPEGQEKETRTFFEQLKEEELGTNQDFLEEMIREIKNLTSKVPLSKRDATLAIWSKLINLTAGYSKVERDKDFLIEKGMDPNQIIEKVQTQFALVGEKYQEQVARLQEAAAAAAAQEKRYIKFAYLGTGEKAAAQKQERHDTILAYLGMLRSFLDPEALQRLH